MKNIHVLPTDKQSRLYLHSDNELQLRTNIIRTSEDYLGSNQHIYITSDEKIKEGDWFYDLGTKYIYIKQSWENSHLDFNGKKIILTTDPDLIKDGVQPIDDEFLEWFVNNPSCEEIELEEIEKYKSTTYDQPDRFIGYDYKIIIPKEEPKQETIEEVAHEMLVDYGIKSIGQSIGVPTVKKLMVNMAKWQAERSQSIVPFDAYNIEVFAIKPDEQGKLFAYIGYKISNGNFHFSIVPFTEPKEEPKQETPEEAAERFYPIPKGGSMWMPSRDDLNKANKQEGFIEGAKWQAERMYSEEEAFNLCREFAIFVQRKGPSYEKQQEWFEQFKKK